MTAASRDAVRAGGSDWSRCIVVCAGVPYEDLRFAVQQLSLQWLLRRRVAAALRSLGGRSIATVVRPPLRPLLEGDLVRLAPFEAERFADEVEAALATPDDDARRAHRRAFAAGHSWARRAERLAAALDPPVSLSS